MLLTLTVDLKGILRLGPKLVAMYLGASFSIMLGAVVAFQLMRWLHPATVAGDTWAGMAALAGSWIGGGANMLAMREVFDVDATTFRQFAVVDVGVGYVWMALLIFLAPRAAAIDARSGADTRGIDDLKMSAARPRRRWWRPRSIRRWRRSACCWARWVMPPAPIWRTWSGSPCARWRARASAPSPTLSPTL
ncbi:hypothetical protein XTPLMG730_2872 [Xanthomonas translucens pv. phlei]|uniref:Transmembrane protein n=1 Tax=Xanthomonas graminis pv. phlei TaxID=487906 RepID=A0A0K3A054_9XANT|nr:DUF819 family protein [Xanthomonas translucens]CTP90632.1 hypothetical protein XTPLMG730_2872 [Xanthomonas translucens pv. phlei]